jgi:hypothetical protein
MIMKDLLSELAILYLDHCTGMGFLPLAGRFFRFYAYGVGVLLVLGYGPWLVMYAYGVGLFLFLVLGPFLDLLLVY